LIEKGDVECLNERLPYQDHISDREMGSFILTIERFAKISYDLDLIDKTPKIFYSTNKSFLTGVLTSCHAVVLYRCAVERTVIFFSACFSSVTYRRYLN